MRRGAFRWGQLALGIVAMMMIANLQYGWTLFVVPIDYANHWGIARIQVAFTLFVLGETWLLPFQGYLIDRIGPRPTVAAGGVLVGAGWLLNSYADTLTLLYVGRGRRRQRCRHDLRRCGRQCLEMVSRPARARRRIDRRRLRRGLGCDHHPDRPLDRQLRLSIRVLLVGVGPGRGSCWSLPGSCAWRPTR